MPYRKVQFAQGQFYHIYNRGVGRQPIFREEENYFFLLRRLKTYAAALNITAIAYCLMPNHYHFLLRQMTPAAQQKSRRTSSDFNGIGEGVELRLLLAKPSTR